jgi:hypothetical protein
MVGKHSNTDQHAGTHVYRHIYIHTLKDTHTHTRVHIQTPITHNAHIGLARTIYILYTAYIRYFWQGNHRVYGHIWCVYTVWANPTHTQTHMLLMHAHLDELMAARHNHDAADGALAEDSSTLGVGQHCFEDTHFVVTCVMKGFCVSRIKPTKHTHTLSLYIYFQGLQPVQCAPLEMDHRCASCAQDAHRLPSHAI